MSPVLAEVASTWQPSGCHITSFFSSFPFSPSPLLPFLPTPTATSPTKPLPRSPDPSTFQLSSSRRWLPIFASAVGSDLQSQQQKTQKKRPTVPPQALILLPTPPPSLARPSATLPSPPRSRSVKNNHRPAARPDTHFIQSTTFAAKIAVTRRRHHPTDIIPPFPSTPSTKLFCCFFKNTVGKVINDRVRSSHFQHYRREGEIGREEKKEVTRQPLGCHVDATSARTGDVAEYSWNMQPCQQSGTWGAQALNIRDLG